MYTVKRSLKFYVRQLCNTKPPNTKKDKDTKLNFTLFTPLVNLPRLFRLFSLIPGSFRE